MNRSEVYYHYAEREGPSRDLAYNVAQQLEQKLGFPGAKSKVIHAYYVLRENQYPAILGEASYLSNLEAEKLYQDPSIIQAEAEGYFEAILDFFQTGYPKIEWKGILGRSGIESLKKEYDTCPWFAARVTDEKTGVCEDGIEVSIDDRAIPFQYTADSGDLLFTSPGNLPSGTHTIRIVAQNTTGRYGHALEKEFFIHTNQNYLEIDVEPHRVLYAPESVARLTVRGFDKYGYPISNLEEVEINVEGAEVLNREEQFTDGRLYLYFRPTQDRVTIKTKGGHHEITKIFSTTRINTFPLQTLFTGWVLNERTGEPVEGAMIRMEKAVPVQSDRMGWFNLPELEKGAMLRVQASGYWPKDIRVEDFSVPAAEFTVKMKPMFGGVMQGKKIVLDPEFGGMETGQIGSNGLRASDVNLASARLTRSLLEACGASVEMTRDDDRTMSDVDRVYFGLARDFDWFISIRHAEPRPGQNEDPELNASRAYAKWSDARQMAAVFPKYMQALLGTDVADTKNCSTWEVMHASNRFQAIGLSPLFMTAPGAAERLSHWATLRKEAQAVLYGLIEYFTFQNEEGLLPPPKEGEPSYEDQLQDITGSFHGIVTDAESDKPLEDVLIGVEESLWTGTEGDGQFQWQYLEPGQYALSFSKPGVRISQNGCQ